MCILSEKKSRIMFIYKIQSPLLIMRGCSASIDSSVMIVFSGFECLKLATK